MRKRKKSESRAQAETEGSWRIVGSWRIGACGFPAFVMVICISFKRLKNCLGVLMSGVCVLGSERFLTEERKTFGLMIILALLIFRQHQFPLFPKDLGSCIVSQLPIFGKICRGKGNIKCLSHPLQKYSESKTKPYSNFFNLQILIFVFEVKVHPANAMFTPEYAHLIFRIKFDLQT